METERRKKMEKKTTKRDVWFNNCWLSKRPVCVWGKQERETDHGTWTWLRCRHTDSIDLMCFPSICQIKTLVFQKRRRQQNACRRSEIYRVLDYYGEELWKMVCAACGKSKEMNIMENLHEIFRDCFLMLPTMMSWRRYCQRCRRRHRLLQWQWIWCHDYLLPSIHIHL